MATKINDCRLRIIAATVCDGRDVFPKDEVQTDPETAQTLLLLGKAHMVGSEQEKKWLADFEKAEKAKAEAEKAAKGKKE